MDFREKSFVSPFVNRFLCVSFSKSNILSAFVCQRRWLFNLFDIIVSVCMDNGQWYSNFNIYLKNAIFQLVLHYKCGPSQSQYQSYISPLFKYYDVQLNSHSNRFIIVNGLVFDARCLVYIFARIHYPSVNSWIENRIVIEL